jgi:hypothetical protein
VKDQMVGARKVKRSVAKTGETGTVRIVNVGSDTPERARAEVGLSPLASNAETARLFAKGFVGDVQIGDAIDVLRDKIDHVQRGDLSDVEATLTAQAVALDAIFNGLAKRAVLNMGTHIGACETYLRLALKAQAQCRATLETLAEVKYPRVPTFVRQQNVAYQQQVNNDSGSSDSKHVQKHPHAEKGHSEQNKLLKEHHHGSTYLDSRATPTAGSSDQALEAVGEVHWTEKRRG